MIVKVLLIYRKNKTNVHQFLELIPYIIQKEQPTIVTGDFNINLFQDSNNVFVGTLSTLGYQQMVMQPTCIHGSLIDHLYIRNTFLYCVPISIHLHTLYFTDHDAIILRM